MYTRRKRNGNNSRNRKPAVAADTSTVARILSRIALFSYTAIVSLPRISRLLIVNLRSISERVRRWVVPMRAQACTFSLLR